jgi:hypothetical protein
MLGSSVNVQTVTELAQTFASLFQAQNNIKKYDDFLKIGKVNTLFYLTLFLRKNLFGCRHDLFWLNLNKIVIVE